MSKFIEESVRWQVFDQSITGARARITDVPANDLQALIDEATQSIKNEMRQELSGNECRTRPRS
jgi:Ribbon-helix-helix domain